MLMALVVENCKNRPRALDTQQVDSGETGRLGASWPMTRPFLDPQRLAGAIWLAWRRVLHSAGANQDDKER